MAVPRIAPWMLAVALALAWLAFGPPTPDLAAQVYRTGLFEREGWTIFDLSWVRRPPHARVLDPLPTARRSARSPRRRALAAVASAILFEQIARRHFGREQARRGALLFAAGTAADLLIGRLTFALGVAFALGAILALQDGRRRVGLALAVCCSLASPVAGLFLALAGFAHKVSRRPGPGLWLAAAAFTPVAVLAILFPEGGSQPFGTAALAAIAASCALLLWLLPARERMLRAGVLLYLGSALIAFAVASPMGGNASRLGVAFAGPLLLCAALPVAASPRRRRLVLATVLPLLVWQWWAPARETFKGAVDPSARRAYFRPLLAFLDERADAAPVRVEVPFTRLHWEAVHVARTTSLARGWETQLDVKYNPIFRASGAARLTPRRYRDWLAREGVHYVALPDVPLDPTGRAEAALIRRGLPFLRPVFRDRHWEVFEVLHTPGLTNGVARLTRLGPHSFTLRARSPGFTFVRVRYTPYWRIGRGAGCVARAIGGWTLVRSARAGTIVVETAFDPRRILDHSASCAAL